MDSLVFPQISGGQFTIQKEAVSTDFCFRECQCKSDDKKKVAGRATGCFSQMGVVILLKAFGLLCIEALFF